MEILPDADALLDARLFHSFDVDRFNRSDWEKAGADVCPTDFMALQRADSIRLNRLCRHFDSDNSIGATSQPAQPDSGECSDDMDCRADFAVAFPGASVYQQVLS